MCRYKKAMYTFIAFIDGHEYSCFWLIKVKMGGICLVDRKAFVNYFAGMKRVVVSMVSEFCTL